MTSQTGVRGFRFAALPANIRKDGRADLALAVSDRPAAAAAVFTRNLVRAAPVELAARRVSSGRAQAVLVNSGCANACTGEAGTRAAVESSAAVARALGLEAELVLPASTGVIGALLPSDKIASKAADLAAALSPDPDGFSRAILTTDRWPKIAQRVVEAGGQRSTLLGIAKGAGMIHPDMGPPQATMLAFVFSDAALGSDELSTLLGPAVDASFNACSVDGDTSTNDCVYLLANGASGSRPSLTDFGAALSEVCGELARSMVKDGEGANHVAEIVVRGLGSDEEARQVARTVATSLLVKTALFGQDINWGRLVGAAGRAGVAFDPQLVSIRVGEVEIVRHGLGLGSAAEERANQVLTLPEYVIEISLGAGPGGAVYLTSDLGHGYVDVNAGYRT